MSPVASFLIGILLINHLSVMYRLNLWTLARPFSKMVFLLVFFLLIGSVSGFAQVQTRIVAGQISIENTIKLDEKSYLGFRDTLDKKLKANPHDTTSLFYKALLLEQFNNQLAKPTAYTKDPIRNLTLAKDMTEDAMRQNMKDLRLKILRAQIYKDLVYRYSVSESWKFTNEQIAERKVKYNNYKSLANQYYDELAKIDSSNAYDYQRLKVDSN